MIDFAEYDEEDSPILHDLLARTFEREREDRREYLRNISRRHREKTRNDARTKATLQGATSRHKASQPMRYWSVKAVTAARGRAKQAGMACDITKEHIRDLFDKQGSVCAACGSDFVFFGGKVEWHRCATIDRIDNAKGYLTSNVAILCMRCNHVKGDIITREEVSKLRLLADWLEKQLP